MINDLKKYIQLACSNQLDAKMTSEAFDVIMSGKASDGQIGAFLIALQINGVNKNHVLGALKVMQKKMIKQGLKPALLYGAKVRGIAPQHVNAPRNITSQCLPGRHFGKSRTLRLSMFKADPLHGVAAAPLFEWASAIWDRTAASGTLKAAWRRQMVRLGTKPRWNKVEGPAGAVRMQLVALGWKWPAWHAMITSELLTIDLREVCPDDLRNMAVRDSERAI